MGYERFVAGQLKAVNRIFVLFVGLVTLMWIATFVDYAFSLGWGWDRQILWLGPAMVIFALLVRFCAMAIMRFVRGSY